MEQSKGKVKREFLYTEDDFKFIKDIVYKESGIHLSDIKQDMVYSRLARRLRALNLKRFDDYCRYVEDNFAAEIGHTINAITTNLTHFFREEHHFDMLKGTIIPELLKNKPRGKRLRIWSAGCSTGEEPYSIAMCLKDTLPKSNDWDAKILASDLDTTVIEKCRSGIYDVKRVDPIEDKSVKRWFRPQDATGKNVVVDDELKQMITFKQLNLMDPWPVKGPFDVIFCRNVIIYFDKPTQQKLFARFYELLAPGGYLFLGHSEQLGAFQKHFDLLGKTSFRKT